MQSVSHLYSDISPSMYRWMCSQSSTCTVIYIPQQVQVDLCSEVGSQLHALGVGQVGLDACRLSPVIRGC